MTAPALRFEPALLAGEAGWEAIELPPVYPNQGSFLHDVEGSAGKVRLAYFRAPGDSALLGKAWFGPLCLGPPGHAHGGSLAAVLDEAMGLACWMGGHTVVAASITVDFLRLVPLGQVTRLCTQVTAVEGRKVRTQGTIEDASGAAYTRATGLFVVLPAERLPGLVDPGTWATRG